jgi:RNA polymerase sigma factor (sigma-70 family)
MSPFDAQKPSTPQTLTTDSGVTVVVKPAPPPEPKPEPEEPARLPHLPSTPRIVVRPRWGETPHTPRPGRPPERPAQEGKRDAFVRRLDAEHGRFLRATCRAQGDVNEESTKDLAQRVLITAGEQFDKHDFETHGLPKNLRGWLFTLVRNEASNRRRVWKPKVEQGADVEAASCPAPDPEGTAVLAERRAKLSRYLAALPREEAEVVSCIDLYEMTIEQTATAVRRPWGTVAAQLARARAKLVELVHESKRATDAGERRRPVGQGPSPPRA